ncbi:hypothetical protein M419DRAFT_84925, partial [Trichoderma reesei RUT C-30]
IGDERKPRCQRCIDTESECIYGQRLSFLQKNAFTLSPDGGDGSSSSSPRGTTRYLKFANDRAARKKDVGRSEEASTSAARVPANVEERTGTHHVLRPNGGTKATSSASSSGQQNLCLDSGASNDDSGRIIDKTQDVQAQNDASSHGLDGHDRQYIGTSHGDSYEIALDVLMNLGTGDPSADTLTPGTPTFENRAADNVESPPLTLRNTDDFGPLSVNVQHQLSSARTIELLRHYRYKIAPWLDMCDLNQTFGLAIPHLATRSDVSFDALLQLCATSKANNPHEQISSHSHTSSGDHSAYSAQYDLGHTNMWEVKLRSILIATKDFLIDPPKSWDDALAQNRSLQMICSDGENSPLQGQNGCMLWLLARLGE